MLHVRGGRTMIRQEQGYELTITNKSILYKDEGDKEDYLQRQQNLCLTYAVDAL